MKDIQRYKIEDGLLDFGIKGGFLVRNEHHTAIVAAIQEQVRALAAENSKLRDWLISDTMCEVDETAFPATDAAIREIRAQAVEVFAEYIAFYHSDSKSHVLDYAARIRSGEQP